MATIKGTLHRITYKNEDNHYTIARLKIHEIKEPVTIVGHLAGVAEGEMLSLIGKWVSHTKYGDQFKVETFEVTLPSTLAEIRRYLGSGMIKGIGESMAKKIVDYFKEESLEIIENEPHRLCEIPGIGKTKMLTLSRAWDQHHAIRKVMQFLQVNGIGIAHASAIINFYGRDALKILKDRPYQLSKDVPEAGFEIADAIALKTGTDPNAPERIKASIIYILLQNEANGHVFIDSLELFERCARLTGADADKFYFALLELIDGLDVVEEQGFKHIYTRKMYRAETGIAQKIKAMLSISVPDYGIDEDEITFEVLNRLELELSEEQSDIVRELLSHRITVITGGPGTGKTTLV
ncbi:MAG: ATP-dependent RecD-like DNA helicase, partial [Desulfamplus sp.]|nr:ATP-dependent RecD-like DNA helicase [Desulfamplus sp.]